MLIVEDEIGSFVGTVGDWVQTADSWAAARSWRQAQLMLIAVRDTVRRDAVA